MCPDSVELSFCSAAGCTTFQFASNLILIGPMFAREADQIK
jgi:hypothetical protein